MDIVKHTNQEIADLIEQCQFSKALKMLLAQEKELGDDLDRKTKIAFCHYKLGDYEQAEELLHEVLEQKPRHPQAQPLLQEIERRPLSFDVKQDLTDAPRIKRKACPNCGEKISGGFTRCPHCKYVLKGHLTKQIVLYIVLPLLLLTLIRIAYQSYYGVMEELEPGDEVNLWNFVLYSLPLFVLTFSIGIVSLLLSTFSLNFALPDRVWNEDWQLDLGAAFICMTLIVLTNIFGRYFAARSDIFVVFFFVLQFIILFVFFQRGFIQTVLLYFLFISYKAIFYIIIYAITGFSFFMPR